MFFQEARYALRNLARSPRFSLVAGLTLALAVGGAGALFSLLNAVVLRRLPVAAPEQLVAVYPANGEALFGISMPTLAELSQRQRSLQGICGASQGASLNVEIDGALMTRPAELVTGDCHAILGLRPGIGRLIGPDEAPLRGNSSDVIVLSHRFWQDVFQGDGAVLGRSVRLEGSPVTIIGVAPATYRGLNADEAADIIAPLGLVSRLRGSPSATALHLIGRLPTGETLDQARVQLRAVWPEAWRTANPGVAPGAASRAGLPESLRVERLSGGFSTLRGRYSQPLYALFLLAVLLLLLASVNVGGLFLTRTISREQELAVNMALGAGRGRLATQLLSEGMAIAIGAAIVAIPIAWWTSRALALLLWTGTRPLTMAVTPDRWALVLIAATALLAGLCASLPPLLAVRLRRWDLAASHTRGVFASTGWWSKGLIAGQVSASLVLLFLAALFVRNLTDIRSLDLGYDPATLQFTRLEPAFGAPRSNDQAAYLRDVLTQVSAIPGVESAAVSLGFPTTAMIQTTALTPFLPDGADAPEIGGMVDRVSPGFFQTAGLALLAGRDFSWQDTLQQPAVAVISQPMASRLFPNGDAVGRNVRIAVRNQVVTVVGVVSDAAPGDPRIRDMPRMYRPGLQEPQLMGSPVLLIRSADSKGLFEAVRSSVEPLKRHRVTSLRTIDEQLDRFLIQERVLVRLSSAFALLGLLTVTIGLYALLAYSMLRRTREIAVRMALGATRQSVLALVFRESLAMVFTGLLIGIPLAFFAAESARGLFYRVSSYDPFAYGAASGFLLLVAAFATGIPALRTMRTELSEAMREV